MNAEATLTRTGKDGAEPCFALFGGDHYIGDVLAGKWKKCPDFLSVGGWQAKIGTASPRPLQLISNGVGTAWIYSRSKAIFLDDWVHVLHLGAPAAVTAGKVWSIYQYFTDRCATCDPTYGTYDPENASNYLRFGFRNNNGTFAYSLYTRKAGEATLPVVAWTSIGTVNNIVMRLEDQEGLPNHEHSHFHVLSGGTYCGYPMGSYTLDGIYALGLGLTAGYPAYRIVTDDATSRTGTSQCIVEDYPDFTIKYDVSDANRFLGECKVYDTRGSVTEADWARVYDPDHIFIGDLVVQNGLIRLVVDELAADGFSLYLYYAAAWNKIQTHTHQLLVDLIWLHYPSLVNLVKVSSEEIMFRVAFLDSATNDRNYYVSFLCSLRRGNYLYEFTLEDDNPRQYLAINTTMTNPLYAYVQDSLVGDDNLDLEPNNTTVTDNFAVAFDLTHPVLMVYTSTRRDRLASYRGQNLYNAVGVPVYIGYKTFFGAIPFADVDHLYMEAESATLGGGADTADVAGDWGTSARLNAQNETCDYTVIAGTDLPAGRYVALWRVEDTAQVALDVELSAYNSTDGTYRNQDNADTHRVVTAAWLYYQQIFDITATDVAGTDNIRLRIKKDTATANTIYCDYILVVPIGNGESWPGDLAHNAMRNAILDRRIVRR